MAFRRWANRSARGIAVAAVLVTAACSAGGTGGITASTHAAAGPAPAAAAPAGTARAAPASARAVTAAPSASVPPRSPAAAASAPTGAPAHALSRAPAAPAGNRLATFVNRVQQTIWVAAAPDPAHPLAATGWVLPPGQTVTIVVPDHWNGRFWGRTGCVFSGGRGHCQTGDCGGLFQCTGYGAIPATLAEYNLNAWDGLDFYDVSMVDGANLPMYINITKGGTPDRVSASGCVAAGCTTPVGCPAALQVKVGSSVVACDSACARFGTDQYCCRAAWASRADCNPALWPVDYAAVFKRAEPYAYSYADDDATSTYTCTGECDYRVTFGVTPGG